MPLGIFVAARESTPRNGSAVSQVLRCGFVGQVLSRRKTGVLIPAIEPCEFCAQVVCGDALYRGRKTSAMFSRFCGAKQRLSKPLRGNSTDFAAGECPRFPSPTQQAPPRHKTDKLPLTLQQKCSTMQWHRGVAQLVARLLWEQDAAGSSPVTSTKNGAGVRLLRFYVVCGELGTESIGSN